MSLEKCFEFVPADVTRVNDLGAGGRHIAGCVFRVLGGLFCQYNICSANPLSYLMRELHSCLTQKPPYIPILAISLLRRSEKISSLESRVQRPAMLDDAT